MCLLFQIVKWIDEIGEPFLRDHVDIGSSLEQTEKYCNEFTSFLDEVSLQDNIICSRSQFIRFR